MAEQLDLFATSSPATIALSAPPDQAARDIVAGCLDTTLFVEAGAGSGKTTALVARIVNLVLDGVAIGSIAAITFTEKAAAELRHRVRDVLTTALRDAGPDAALISAALADLDHAPIGTLHAFARRLLSEFPIESRLPPRFAVLAEVQSASAFHERYTDFLHDLLDEAANVRLVELCQADSLRIDSGVRRIADDFQANWDLVEERVSPALPTVVEPAIGPLLALCDRVLAFIVPDGDSQEPNVIKVRESRGRLAEATALGEVLEEIKILKDLKQKGSVERWRRAGAPPSALVEMRACVSELAVAAQEQLAALMEERRLTLGALLRDFTLASVEERRQAGELEFHDLLVFARRLVAGNAAVRAALHRRYTHLLLDEFQDTDPIQLELAVRLTADPTTSGDADWRALRPLPGRLCVVGDPKQSIYRFRRADISQYLAAKAQIGATGATLSANFRSSAPVIRWINDTMGKLIVAQDSSQPAYAPLDACRIEPSSAGGVLGSVTVLGADAHDSIEGSVADELRARESRDVADVVVQAISAGWPVLDASARSEGDGAPVVRPCTAGDIAVLLPSRISLGVLQAALAERGVAHRAENSSLVYAAPEIRSLMLALRAADDPTDALAIVSALRTPLFGCSDRNLYEWKVEHGQRWGWAHPPPAQLADHPVAVALATLGELAAMIPWSTPSQLLDRLITTRCATEIALASPHSRDIWRRLRFVVDQARAWSEAGGHGVRRYLLWTRLQGDDGRFVAETVLPETDHDAVRIMTVHAAKGLEFPITIVSGMTTQPRGQSGRRVVWPDGTWTLASKDDPVYQQFQPIDEQMSDAERIRLLYVACTRACDHLVVSLHRAAGAHRPRTAAELLADACNGAEHRCHVPSGVELVTPEPPVRELAWSDEPTWDAERTALLARAATPRVLSATSLAAQFAADPALQKDAVDVDLPPWQRGRYGTAIGRAVHGVLQFADLRTGANVTALAAAQAAAEGVLGHEQTIARLARSALGAEIVSTGCRHEHWRELFVATAIGERVIEGYIDLLVRHPERGLVVVDYKTDQLAAGAHADERLRRYGVQLAAYAVALEDLLGEPVHSGVLVMCRRDGPALEVPIPDWRATQSTLRAALLAGSTPP